MDLHLNLADWRRHAPDWMAAAAAGFAAGAVLMVLELAWVAMFGAEGPWRSSHLVAAIALGQETAFTSDFDLGVVTVALLTHYVLGIVFGLVLAAVVAVLHREDSVGSIEALGIEALSGRLYEFLSRGETQRVDLFLALAHEPRMLFLDEPFTGLDPQFARRLGQLLRGLREMARVGEACGARPDTFSGLAGMGDLIVTCWSRHSRNRRAGELLARGFTAEAAAREIGMAVEGITAAPVLGELARSVGVEMPIVDAVGAVLRGTAPLSLVSSLMEREPTTE